MLIRKLSLWAIAVTAAATFAFKPFAGTVKGIVNPPEGAVRAWVLSKTDTFRTNIASGGTFEIGNVKAGTYRLIIEATAPYKNQAKDSISVTDGNITEVGEIRLEK